MDLKKLLEALKSLIGEAEKAANDAEAEGTDEAAKTAARELYKTKLGEIEAIKSKIEKAKTVAVERAKNLALVIEVEQLSQVVPGNIIPHGKVHATAIDHDKEDAELCVQFTNWMGGKTLSGQARTALEPKSAGWKKAKSENGVALPRSLAKSLLPEAFCFGKALPLTSNQASPANLINADFRKDLNMYAGEAPAIFPNTFKIPTSAGMVKWPELLQGAPGAEGTADEFAEYGFVACEWTGEGAEKNRTEPKFSQKDLVAHELSASTDLTRTLLNRSSIDIQAMLPGLFRASLLHKIDHALINGDGVGKPLGVLQTANIGAPARTTNGQVKYDDLVNLEFAIAPQFRANGMYVIADGALKDLRKRKDLQDRPLMLPMNAPITDAPNKKGLNGYAHIATQRTTLGAAGDVIFGDWSHYVCPVEQEIVMASSEHAEFRKGVVVFVCFVQVGGRVMQTRAFGKLPV